jgi:hypothetical protein
MGVARGVARILSFLSGARTDSFQVRGRGADFFFHFVGAILLLFVSEFMDLIQVPGRGADSFVFQILFVFSVIQVRGRGATGGGARELLGAPASHPDLPPAALRVGPRYRK